MLSHDPVINPLAPPENARVLHAFQMHCGLERGGKSPRELLIELARAFATLPYENLTKIICRRDTGNCVEARRSPAEVVADHVRFGTGGTCFSLTATLLHLVRALGFRAEPILADRRYGANTHCALLVWLEGVPHLLDPGYLIVEPLPLDTSREQRVTTAFNELVLTPRDAGRKLDLQTISQGQPKYRLSFKPDPADAGEFLRAWDDSFDWDMMHYPVLTRTQGGEQIYLQGDHFQVRSRNAIHRVELPEDEIVQRIVNQFGIDPAIASRAFAILNRESR